MESEPKLNPELSTLSKVGYPTITDRLSRSGPQLKLDLNGSHKPDSKNAPQGASVQEVARKNGQRPQEGAGASLAPKGGGPSPGPAQPERGRGGTTPVERPSFFWEPHPSKRAPAVHVIANFDDITPEWLRAHGYKYFGDPGGIRTWTHPDTGDSVIVLGQRSEHREASKEHWNSEDITVDDRQPETTLAREMASVLVDWKSRLVAQKEALKQQKGQPGYRTSYIDLVNAWNKWSDEVYKMSKTVQGLRDDLGVDVLQDELDAFKIEEQRIKALHNALKAGEEFRHFFGDLPNP